MENDDKRLYCGWPLADKMAPKCGKSLRSDEFSICEGHRIWPE